MEQLKRWREERAARQSRRILGSGPSVTLPRPSSRVGSISRTGKRGFRFWPAPPPVSPVHPEWDDPSGGRLKTGLYGSIAGHLFLLPLLILSSNVDLSFNTTRSQSFSSGMRVIAISSGGPAGPKAGSRTSRPEPPRPEPPKPKPPEEKKPETKVVAPPTPKTEKPKAGPPVKSVKDATPVPVKDKELAREKGKAEPGQAPAEESVTDPIASEGPLVAGVGPVAGSETSVGGVDGADFPYNYYLEIVRGKISQAWEVPQGMVARGRRIEAVVRFKIMRDGTVAQSIIEVPSGQNIYDQSALRAISMVRRFPPLPQEFGGSFLIVHFQFSFVGR